MRSAPRGARPSSSWADRPTWPLLACLTVELTACAPSNAQGPEVPARAAASARAASAPPRAGAEASPRPPDDASELELLTRLARSPEAPPIELVPWLVARTEHHDASVRTAARETLHRIAEPPILSALRALAESDEDLARLARHELLTHPSRTRRGPGPERAQVTLGDRTRAAFAALRRRDVVAFAALVHPEKGLRIAAQRAPHPRAFSRAEVRALRADGTRITWGRDCGTGDPIVGTPAQILRDLDLAWFEHPDAVTTYDARADFGGLVGDTDQHVEWLFPEGVVVQIERYDPAGSSRWVQLVFEDAAEGPAIVAVIGDRWCP